jgi:hypothetical protein
MSTANQGNMGAGNSQQPANQQQQQQQPQQAPEKNEKA